MTGYRVEMGVQAATEPWTWTQVGSDLPAPATPGSRVDIVSPRERPLGTTRHYRVVALSSVGDSPASAP